MNKNSIFSFALGVAFGSLVTWKLVQTKYAQIAQEEIDSVKEEYSKKAEKKSVKPKKDISATELANEGKNDADLKLYKSKIKTSGYVNYSDFSNNETEVKKEPRLDRDPYVILPEEFGDDEEYECLSFTYYADGFLTDDADMIVEDIPGTVGAKFYEHFGEYEDDSVYVKNDRLKHYYEILSDNRNYKDVLEEKPYLMED